VTVDFESPALEYFKARATQSMFDTYAGISMLKFPEDLRAYEQIIWTQRVEVVLELGTQWGGSALWFRDRLRTLLAYGRISSPRVISLDLELSHAYSELPKVDPAYAEQITLIEGDVRDPELSERVRAMIAPGTSCLVVEDLAHTAETTMAALTGYADFVQPGGFFVVEDTMVDREELRVHPDWPRGALDAVREWLAGEAGGRFRQRRDMELYGMSSNPEGFLERVA
jgi:cephalosporin hydroxylase